MLFLQDETRTLNATQANTFTKKIREKTCESVVPANTQHCDKVLVRPIMQHCSDVDAVTSKLPRCSKIISTLDSKFNSCCNINFVLTALLQH